MRDIFREESLFKYRFKEYYERYEATPRVDKWFLFVKVVEFYSMYI